jgi:hypothetical protein
MAEEVTDPEGHRWVVRRRWVPRLPGETLWNRFRRRFGRGSRRVRDWDGLGDVASGFADGGDGIGGILAGIALVIAVLLLLVIVLPLLLAFVEVLALAVLALVAVGARILFRRPWTIEAVDGDGSVLSWRIVGWRASGDHARLVARQLRRGLPPPGAEVGHTPESEDDEA